MPTDIAILNAALEGLKKRPGMGHPSDKKAVAWTFKILKKRGVFVDPAVVRQSLLDAGMPIMSANEITEAAVRVAEGGRFQKIGQ